jgi:Tol biopolymer transport system component
MRKSLLRIAATSLTAAGLLAATPAAAGATVTERVSVDSAGAQATGSSLGSAVSADGRYVAFLSDAPNLVAGDFNATFDIFVHDRQTDATERVSVNSAGGEADAGSFTPAISANGRHVAFQSSASNLVVGDSNGTVDIFIHDRQTDTTERASVNSAEGEADEASFEAAVSADGRYVAFTSAASNLVAGDTNQVDDVFVRDRQAGTTERVNVNSVGNQTFSGSRGSTLSASISADGRYVAFDSPAADLVAGDANNAADVFVRDRQTGATERASVDSAGGEGNGDSFEAAISADGRSVAFFSNATDLVAGDTNNVGDVLVHDRPMGVTERVSVDSAGAQGNGISLVFGISADGRHVAFDSDAPNLVPDDGNGVRDVFLRDRRTGTTERVSVDSLGGEANGSSSGSAPGSGSISADGRYVAFASLASNLVPGDTNGLQDVFVRDRGAVAGPGDQIRARIGTVSGLGPHHGTERSLTAKLEQALAAVEDGDPATDPCGPLRAFGNHVRAQTGKKLTAAQAARLNGDLTAIQASLGCVARA